MSLNNLFFALVLSMIIINAISQKLICYSKSLIESETIYKYLRGQNKGYFIDLYPENPILDSSTVYVRSQGWEGINVLKTVDSFKEFERVRGNDINILGSFGRQDSQVTLKWLCDSFASKQADLLIIQAKHRKQFLSDNLWNDQKCKPKLILMKLYGDNSKFLKESRKEILAQGYTEQVTSEKILLFVENSSMESYKDRLIENSKLISENKLVPFSAIIENIGKKVIGANESIGQLEGDIVHDKLKVDVAICHTGYNTIQITNSKAPSHTLVLEFNPTFEKLLIDSNSASIKKVEMEGFKYIYAMFMKNGLCHHFHIFDHGFVEMDLRELNVVYLSNEISNFGSLEEYDLDKIDKFNAGSKTEPNQSEKVKDEIVVPKDVEKNGIVEKQKDGEEVTEAEYIKVSISAIVIGLTLTSTLSVIFTVFFTLWMMKRIDKKERALAGTRIQNNDILSENNSEQFSEASESSEKE